MMNREVSANLCGLGIFEIAFRIVYYARDCSSRSTAIALIGSDVFLVCSLASSTRLVHTSTGL